MEALDKREKKTDFKIIQPSLRLSPGK